MPLEVVLTVGWPEVSSGDRSAKSIHEACQHAAASQKDAYRTELLRRLSDLREETACDEPITLEGMDETFRRRAREFSGIKKFAGTLNDLVTQNPNLGTVRCHMDVFAYAFLKAAKNFDFFLPEIETKSGPFRDIHSQWLKEVGALEAFEREGKSSPKFDREAYLNLRRIVARPSARDEQRALATLLVSGPSTSEEVAKDLGLPYGLSDRILPTYQEIQVLEIRNGKYVIRKEALPRVIFCLREVMGIDLLPVLSEGGPS